MGEWGAMTSRRRGMQGCGDGPERSIATHDGSRSEHPQPAGHGVARHHAPLRCAGGAYDTRAGTAPVGPGPKTGLR